MSQPKIAIIILNWNRPTDTLECLESLQKIHYSNYEIVVVDNGSTDDSVALIKQSYPTLCMIENGENLGFAEGNNRGIEAALAKNADYILLLNNDTVVHPDILQAFAAAATEHPNAGAFGAKIYFYDEPTLIWHAGGDIDKHGRCVHIGCGECDLEKKRETIAKIGYACGCAILIKSEVVRRVGMLCPKFFLIWEEIDFCWRVRNAGYDCLFVPKAKLWHKISTSFEGGNHGPIWQYFYWRNRLLFLEKHLSPKKRFKFYLMVFPREFFFILMRSFKEKSEQNRALYKCALKGIRDYAFRKFGPGTIFNRRRGQEKK
ncbi:MAG TPA: glycosyltransferase family 2 protein [Rhabdochlamydiaceae bacterium]|nr:glycosyltransferase family 2 protein [Rhabdochlamydiaceae bacterium]